MESTGIVRRVDELGRICLPKELRAVLDIKDKDGLEIFVDGDQIILRKHEPACIFYGSADSITNFKGKNICPDCIAKMSTLDVELAVRKSVVGGSK